MATSEESEMIAAAAILMALRGDEKTLEDMVATMTEAQIDELRLAHRVLGESLGVN